VTRPCARSCIGPVHGRVHGPCTYTAVFMARRRVQYMAVFMTRARPCNSRVHGLQTVVYTTRTLRVHGACTRPCTRSCTRPVQGHGHGMCIQLCTRPCTAPSTWPCTRPMYTAVCIRPVNNGGVAAVYTVVYTCTRPLHGHETARVHSRVHDRVDGRVQAVYTAYV